MATDSEKMNRLSPRLRKIGFRVFPTNGGVGQDCIVNDRYEPVKDSEYWIVDFLQGRISGTHICKALLQGVTPDEVAAAAAAKKRLRSTRRASATSASNDLAADEPPAAGTTGQE